jgi:hypothetical protein
MIIWGGGQTLAVNTGGRYDLASDTWTPTSTGTAPSPRYSNTATWTGNSMVVWGGAYTGGGYLATGGRYDPLLDSWSPTSTIDAPSPRQAHSAVWTGIELIIWGGGDGAPIGSGARYDPVFDRWQPLSAIGAPVARAGHSAVWTGTRMIVWGGSDGAARVNTGGSYDPLGDTWTPLSTLNAPIPRFRHTAVWTGTVMIVWGGSTTSLGTNTGGRYDPILDTWTATSLASAPSARDDHTAVWSGSRMVVWGGYGGGYLASGGRYNPAADTWTPTSSIGAPYARSLHTAVWTAQEMIVWGGSGPASPNGTFNSGGRYDPTGDSWLPTSTAGAPPARDQLRAVWTGSLMIVWGGNLFTGGGQYAIGHARDDDDDGYTECGGDCDDANPGRAPGTAEICNGIDDNCDGVVPLSEADADSDGVPACLFDCDDENAASYPGNPEICDNIDNDCDGSVDGYTTLCGVGGCARAGACTSGIDTCVPGTPVAEACDGVDNDCNGAIPSAESDLDHDGFAGCAGDCDDTDPERYSGALELNNGQDDQCPGDAGSGLIDEVSGSLVFSDPATLCWPPQGGATSYELGRSADRAFPVGCATFQSASACIVDSAVPPSRGVFYYLVRSVSPFLGSWDATSSGERVGACDPGHFVLHDTLANDAAPDALAQFFSITPATTSDYLHFGIVGGSLPGFEWCAERADFYRDSYLELAATDGGANSGGWQVWFRRAGEAWTGPSVETHFNAYGDSCFGPYSWCSEILLDDRSLVANPADVGQCEANDLVYGCGDGTATLTITIGPDRVSACGF